MAKKTVKPKHFAGALISGGIQLGSSIYSAVLKKRALDEQNKLQQKNLLSQEAANDKALTMASNANAEMYSNYIANHPELVYGTQKEIQALGDDGLDTITKDMQLVNAGSHESGNDLERRNDFVEGGEVVSGENGPIHSNRINAYSPAQFSASMGILLDEVSRISKRASGPVKGDLDRLGVKITSKIDDITNAQEAIKDDYGFMLDKEANVVNNSSSPMGNQNITNKPKRGGGYTGFYGEDDYAEDTGFFNNPTLNKLKATNNNNLGFASNSIDTGKILDSFEDIPTVSKSGSGFLSNNSQYIGLGFDLGASIIDNIYNAKMLKKTPKVPKPIFHKATPFDTTIDVEDQLSEITDQQAKLEGFIDASTGSSNTAIQRKRAAGTEAIKAKNTVLGQKERIETDLENREALNKQEIENRNRDFLTAYDRDVADRENQILTAKSQNIANLSRDISDVANKFRMTGFQNQQLMNDAMKYGDTGVFASAALQGNYDNLPNSGKQELLNMLISSGRTADYTALKARWGL